MSQRLSIASCVSATPLLILVVEDEPLLRQLAVDYLEDSGFAVLEAATVREAIDVIQAATSKIDLVFSDIQMPGGLDG